MLIKLFLTFLFIVVGFFLWLSYENPKSVEFYLFGREFETDLPVLMVSSFVVGALLVFIGTLIRDIKHAIQNYKKLREMRKAESVKEEMNKGMDYLIRGNLKKAKNHFIEVLKKDPYQLDTYLKVSEIAIKEGNQDEGIHWLERARLIDMKNIEIMLRQAELYHMMKRYDEAIYILNEALNIDENNIQTLRDLRSIYQENKRWQDAIRIQKSILKLIKGKQIEEEETLFLLGLKYEYANELLKRGGKENLEEALKEAREIIKERKTFQPGFILLGDIYLRMGKWVSAGKVWGKSFSRFKSIIFILKLEELYLNREDPSTLIRIYQRAIKHNPDNWELRFFFAKLCLRLEMLDEALEEIEEISLKLRDFPALHRLLAEIYLHKKDFNRAANEFEKTFELSGTAYIPFICSVCERESKEWIAYCPQCGKWATYKIKSSEKLANLPMPSLTEEPHIFFGS